MVRIIFSIEFKVKLKLNKVATRLIISDSNQDIRFLCNNLFQDNYYTLNESNDSSVKVDIPNFPLPNRNYKIGLTTFSENGIEDDIENAFEFTVVGRYFFKTGREQVMKEGVLIDYNYILDAE